MRKILEICHINNEEEEKSYLNYLDYIEVINKTDEEIEKDLEIEKKKIEEEIEEQKDNFLVKNRSKTFKAINLEDISELNSSSDDDSKKKNKRNKFLFIIYFFFYINCF